jgi:adenylylsulfate kinase
MTPIPKHPRAVWLFGLPSSGKTTLASAACRALRAEGRQVCVLDGDMLRSGLNQDLGFSDEDRAENLRRASHIVRLLLAQGVIVIAAFVTPKEPHRELVRGIVGPDFIRMVHVDCPLEVCVARDVKGLYAKAIGNEMKGMSGVQDSFDAPAMADMVLQTDKMDVAQAVARLLSAIREWSEG